MRSAHVLACTLALSACGTSPVPTPDASSPDATPADASSPDVSSSDASLSDTSSLDAPSLDVSSDASSLDVSVLDSPSVDVSRRDASTPDTSSPDVPPRDASSPDVAPRDVPVPDASSPDGGVTLTSRLEMVLRSNSTVMGASLPMRVYSLPYPPEVNCTESDVCTPTTPTVYRNNAHSRMTDRALGFVVGLTAAPSSDRGGFLLRGSPAGATDRGNVVVFYYDPAPRTPDDPEGFEGDHEFGFVRHVGNQGRGQQLVFYQQYSSNTGACQANAPLVDLTAMGFVADQPGTCLQTRVLPSGDYEVSQYNVTDGQCTGTGAGLRRVTVQNCSIHDTCMPRTRPASCRYPTRNVNFYTGANTHNPGAGGAGTNGILFAAAKKIAGAARLHEGTSLTGFYQLFVNR